MTEELRQLHLLGALGASRVVIENDKEWLVVPTVALMEGVIHPVNAATPEFVSAAVLEKAAASWNGKPVTLGHPTRGGKQCSADDPDIHASHGIGEVRNARYENKKVLCESWIDVAKAGKLHPAMLARLRANEREEVSVGAFVLTDTVANAFNGKPYKASWLETKGDHLAFLPGGRGACSVEMGCGTHRAAAMRVCGDHLELETLGAQDGHPFYGNQYTDGSSGDSPAPKMDKLISIVSSGTPLSVVKNKDGSVELRGPSDRVKDAHLEARSRGFKSEYADEVAYIEPHPSEVVVPRVLTFTSLAGQSLDERIQAVNTAVNKKWNAELTAISAPGSSYAYAKQVFDSSIIVEHDSKIYAIPYDVTADGTVSLGAETEVKQTYVAAKMHECETCAGTGQVKDGENQKDCPMCDGAGEMRAAAGARHSSTDVAMIQGVHDHAVALGAACAQPQTAADIVAALAAAPLIQAVEPELRAACSCGDSTMTKEQKAEVIAALTTDKFSGFKDSDVAFLEAVPEARLEEFKSAAAANKAAAENATKQENDLRAAQAKLTVIEGKLKAAEQAPTEEEWLTRAPSGIKTLLEAQKAQETELREGIIKELKTAGANTEDELKAMPTAQLQTLAKYAKVQAPDFSGRGIPQPRAAAASDLNVYAPPDPYAAELKMLRDKTVN